jgi:hypothetical protein
LKFTQVSLGQRFVYQGETLVKIGPLTATNERGGNTRLIPRSAVVSPLGETHQQPVAKSGLDPRLVETALARFDARWRVALTKVDATERKPLETELASAQSELRAALGLDSVPPV